MKWKDDEGLLDEVKRVNTMPLHLGAFVLSNSKRIIKDFLHSIDGFYNNDVYFRDTDSLYIENKHWDKLDKAGLVGKNRLQGKNDYKEGGIWYGLFLAPKKILFNYQQIWCYRRTQNFQRIYKCE